MCRRSSRPRRSRTASATWRCNLASIQGLSLRTPSFRTAWRSAFERSEMSARKWIGAAEDRRADVERRCLTPEASNNGPFEFVRMPVRSRPGCRKGSRTRRDFIQSRSGNPILSHVHLPGTSRPHPEIQRSAGDVDGFQACAGSLQPLSNRPDPADVELPSRHASSPLTNTISMPSETLSGCS